MNQPKQELLVDWTNRTGCKKIDGETSVVGVPLEGDGPTQRVYTFDGEPSMEELEEYFNQLYNESENHWHWRKVKVVKSNDENPSYKLLPDD